jgi:HSP20 family molecular chaperone IbpA
VGGAVAVADAPHASYDDGILEVEIPLARPDDDVQRVPIEP